MLKQLYYRYVLEISNDARRFYRMVNKNTRRGSRKRSKKDKNAKKSFVSRINTMPTYTALAILSRLLISVGSKLLYVLIFMMLPRLILSSLCSPEGFQLKQALVYFTVVMTCFCGSLTKPGLFDMDEDAYVLLTTMQMEPANYFRGRLITKFLDDFFGFMIAFLIVGFSAPYAFYLVLWILMARVIGEAMNLYIFRCTGRVISEMPGATVAIMAFSIFAAYGFTFVRGYVIDLTKYVYDFVWLFVGSSVSALVLYGLILYEDYSYVAKRFISKMKEKAGENKQEQQDELELLAGDGNLDRRFKEHDEDSAQGVDFLHKVFFLRNTEYIHNAILIRATIVIISTIVTIIVCKMSKQAVAERVWDIICGCLPIMVFIMYCLSATPGVCKSLFYHIDSNVLASGQKISAVYNFRNYVVRLRRACAYDLAIALLVCVALGFIGSACGHSAELSNLVPIYCGVMMLALFYSVFFITIYYMCQPYTKDLKLRNHNFYAANLGMLLIAYGCVYVSINIILFDMIIGVVLALALAASATMVYFLSDKTFKIYRKSF